jgi:Tfp pilus assembly protein PilX
MNNEIKNEKGITLILVLILLVILSITGLSILTFSSSNLKTSVIESNSQSAFYIAEAGVNKTLSDIEKALPLLEKASKNEDEFLSKIDQSIIKTSTFQNFSVNKGNQPTATISIEKNLSKGSYKIISIGTIGERSRKVERVFSVNWTKKTGLVLIPDVAVFSGSTIDLSGSGSIYGAAGTSSKTSNSISLSGGSEITGRIKIPITAGNDILSIPRNGYENYVTKLEKISDIPPYTIPEFPTFPNHPTPPNEKVIKNQHEQANVILNGSLIVDSYLTNNYVLHMTSSLSFNKIEVSSNNKLIINVGNTDKELVVKNLNLSPGHIQIEGTGNLTIFVEDSFNLSGGSAINENSDFNRLKIYVKSKTNPQTLKLSGNQKIFGSLFAENANIDFSGGGGFIGNIVTGGKTVEFSGGSWINTALIYAPNSDVRLSGGAHAKGIIISKSYTSNGGSGITYQSINPNNVPFFGGNNTSGENQQITLSPLLESKK